MILFFVMMQKNNIRAWDSFGLFLIDKKYQNQQMRKVACAKMIFCLLHFLPLFVTFPGLYGLRVNPYGLYEDIVVEISNQVPRQKCQRALDNLEVSPFFLLMSYVWLMSFRQVVEFWNWRQMSKCLRTNCSSSFLLCPSYYTYRMFKYVAM